MTSPPTPIRRACRSVTTPREVVRITTPIPPRMRGIALRSVYSRSPGRLARRSPERICSLRGPYLSVTRMTPCGPRSMKRQSAMKPSSFRMRAISIFNLLAGTSAWSCRAVFALRICVSMSAIGSVITPTLQPPCCPVPAFPRPLVPYQLALTTPGISPLWASWRRQIRHSPNFRNTARGRPHRRQREYFRTLNLGSRFHLMSRAFFANVVLLGRARLAQRQSHQPEQLAGFLVGLRGGHQGDVHAADLLHLVVLDLREDELLAHADVQVAAAVELPLADPLEVLDARQGHAEQLVHELVHAVPAQRHPGGDGHALAQLERRDRFAGPGHRGPLPGDDGQLLDRLVDEPRVRGGIPDAHVHADLLELRDLHDVPVPEALAQLGQDVAPVALPQAHRLGTRSGRFSIPRRGLVVPGRGLVVPGRGLRALRRTLARFGLAGACAALPLPLG